MSHHLLEKGGGILQAEVYHSWYVSPKNSLERGFILIFRFDSVVFVKLNNESKSAKG